MLDLLLEQAGEPNREVEFLRNLSAHIDAVKASAGGGDRHQVARIGTVVEAHPEASFHFEPTGTGTLRTADASIPAGRFEIPLARRSAKAGRGRPAGRCVWPGASMGEMAIREG